MQVKLTKHNFFDPLIPYIIEIDPKTKWVQLLITDVLDLEPKKIAKYFKEGVKLSHKLTTDKVVYVWNLTGTIKDQDVFDYLYHTSMMREKEKAEFLMNLYARHNIPL